MSVRAQSYDCVEHIIQDGGSTDSTIDILRSHGDFVDWESRPDRGQADGLNRALTRSKGDIIIVLNADDELLPQACSWAVEALQAYPEVAVVYGDQYIVNEDGEIITNNPGPHPYDYRKVLCVEQVIPAQAAFIRRSHLEAVGFYVDASLATCPDFEMWVRIGFRFDMIHIPGYVAKYRWHEGSEGRQKKKILEMYKSKRLVMDRLFKDPGTPSELCALSKRAHAGLANWTASMLISTGCRKDGALYALKAVLTYPSMVQLKRAVANILQAYMPGVHMRLHHWMAGECTKKWVG